MPLAQALQEKPAEEIAAEEKAAQNLAIVRAQWLNDPYTKSKIEPILIYRNTQMTNAMTYSLQSGKEADALNALRNAAIADSLIGSLTA